MNRSAALVPFTVISVGSCVGPLPRLSRLPDSKFDVVRVVMTVFVEALVQLCTMTPLARILSLRLDKASRRVSFPVLLFLKV